MKCKFCGTDFDKSNEICPECGKYASDNQLTEMPENADSEPNLGKFIDGFDYKDSLVYTAFSTVGAGVLFLLPTVKEIIKAINYPYYVMFSRISLIDIIFIALFVLGIAFIVLGISSFFNSRKCFVSVYENGISGIVPSSPFTKVTFDILFDDIKEITRKGFYAGRYSSPHIIIKTADRKIQIAFPEKKHTTKLSDHLYTLYEN